MQRKTVSLLLIISLIAITIFSIFFLTRNSDSKNLQEISPKMLYKKVHDGEIKALFYDSKNRIFYGSYQYGSMKISNLSKQADVKTPISNDMFWKIIEKWAKKQGETQKIPEQDFFVGLIHQKGSIWAEYQGYWIILAVLFAISAIFTGLLITKHLKTVKEEQKITLTK